MIGFMLQGKKMLVIGTTSEVGFLDSVGLCDSFSVTYHVPTLKTEDAKKVRVHPNCHMFYFSCKFLVLLNYSVAL